MKKGDGEVSTNAAFIRDENVFPTYLQGKRYINGHRSSHSSKTKKCSRVTTAKKEPNIIHFTESKIHPKASNLHRKTALHATQTGLLCWKCGFGTKQHKTSTLPYSKTRYDFISTRLSEKGQEGSPVPFGDVARWGFAVPFVRDLDGIESQCIFLVLYLRKPNLEQYSAITWLLISCFQ